MGTDNATIMGGDRQWEIETEFIKICRLDYQEYLNNEKILTRKIFESFFNDILNFVENYDNSYIANQVLGVFILKTGSRLSPKIKKKILDSINWNKEKHFWPSKYINERKFYLNDFKMKIQNYIEGHNTYLVDLKMSGDVDFKKICIGIDEVLKVSNSSDKKLITNINLDSSNLTFLPKEIFKYSSLEILSIDHNQLNTLSYSISDLQGLKRLYLRDNLLKKLPDSICYLKSLEVLHLGDNQITDLPDAIGNLKNLKELNIHNNPIKVLPNSIKNLNLSMRSLNLLKLDSFKIWND